MNQIFLLLSIFSIVSCLGTENDDSFLLSTLGEDLDSNVVLQELYHYAQVNRYSWCHLLNSNDTSSNKNISTDGINSKGCSDFEIVGFSAPTPESNQTYMTGLYDHKRKESVFIFAGTKTDNNYLMDMDIMPTPYIPVNAANLTEDVYDCPGCMVHEGFYKTWSEDYEFTLETIAQMKMTNPDYRLVILGHSLGGAVAQLAGLEFYTSTEELPLIVTWGSPQVGNKKFVDYLNRKTHVESSFHSLDGSAKSLSGNIRNQHVNDTIPVLLASFYNHGGVEVWIAKAEAGPSPNEIAICDPSSTISSNVCGGFPKSLIVPDNSGKELDFHEIYYVDQAECPIPTPTPTPTSVRSHTRSESSAYMPSSVNIVILGLFSLINALLV